MRMPNIMYNSHSHSYCIYREFSLFQHKPFSIHFPILCVSIIKFILISMVQSSICLCLNVSNRFIHQIYPPTQTNIFIAHHHIKHFAMKMFHQNILRMSIIFISIIVISSFGVRCKNEMIFLFFSFDLSIFTMPSYKSLS